MFSRALPRVVLSAASSGSGTTTVAIGLITAFRRHRLRVAAANVGPAVIEGATGLCDGRDGTNEGSSAHVTRVFDARSRRAAAVIASNARRDPESLRSTRVRTICVDTECGRIRLRDAAALAAALDATYRHLEHCSERALGVAVREWMATA